MGSLARHVVPLKGQIAQLVERSPEKAGVGGSIPSLATSSINLWLRGLDKGSLRLKLRISTGPRLRRGQDDLSQVSWQRGLCEREVAGFHRELWLRRWRLTPDGWD